MRGFLAVLTITLAFFAGSLFGRYNTKTEFGLQIDKICALHKEIAEMDPPIQTIKVECSPTEEAEKGVLVTREFLREDGVVERRFGEYVGPHGRTFQFIQRE